MLQRTVFLIPCMFATLVAITPELAQKEAHPFDYDVPKQVNFLGDVYNFIYHAITVHNIKSKTSCCAKTSVEYTFLCSPQARYQLPPRCVAIEQYSDSPVISYKVRNPQDKNLVELSGACTITSMNTYKEFIPLILQRVLFGMLHHYCLAFTIRKCSECFGKLHNKDLFDARVFLSCGHIFHLACITTENDSSGEYILVSKCPVCRKEITYKELIWEPECIHPTLVDV